MKIDITDQTRNHLIDFLKKVPDGDYTRNELESFTFSGYQIEVFERIRIKVLEIIADKHRENDSDTGTLSKENRDAIEEIVCELEKQGI